VPTHLVKVCQRRSRGVILGVAVRPRIAPSKEQEPRSGVLRGIGRMPGFGTKTPPGQRKADGPPTGWGTR
jgi:hypothetical protein